MTSLSPYPAYILGAACIGRGIIAIFSPREEYSHMGLPLEHSPSQPANTTATPTALGSASPLMYFKGIREISYGASLVALQGLGEGSRDALTVFAGLLSLVRFGDGLVVWLYGGEKLRYRAWGHWITGAGFVGWVTWRMKHST